MSRYFINFQHYLFLISLFDLNISYVFSVLSKQPITNVKGRFGNLNCIHSDRYTEFQTSVSQTAQLAALNAGNIILSGCGFVNIESDVENKMSTKDIVTEFDKKCQLAIKETIIRHFPHHKFLGEEDIDPGIEASKRGIESLISEDNLWIVDPIDGTSNFAHGMPLSGVIIAFASNGVVQFGCIYDPFRKEMFTAWKGQGAFLNGSKISCCKSQSLKSSIVFTGSPPNQYSLEACLRATELLSPKVRTVRMLGSAAIMLAWVSCGRATAYFETDLNVWDLAAGCLIIEEAGGRVTDVWGEDYSLRTRNLVASNKAIHSELLNGLREAKMWMPEDSNRPMRLDSIY